MVILTVAIWGQRFSAKLFMIYIEIDSLIKSLALPIIVTSALQRSD